MNSNKRKILEDDMADNSDIFKNRPSSTMANLSYISNVIHSANLSTGHSSFREAFILDDEVVISKTPKHVREFVSNITVRRNARNKKIAIRSVDSRLNLLSTDLKDTANLEKNVNDAMVASTLKKVAYYETYKSSSRPTSERPKLSEICNKTEKPEKRHESSKDVILPETGKIFDKRNEFSDEIDSLLINHTSTPRTKLAFETDLRAIVLDGSENSPVLSNPASAVSLHSQKAKNERLEGCNEIEGRPNNDSRIVCTPKAWTKRRSQSDGCTNFESSLKRRLFTDTVVSGETRPYENALARDSNDFESPVPNGRLEQRNIARCSVESIIVLDSPILSGNRRKGNRIGLPLKSSRNLVSGSYYTRESNAPAVFRNNLDSYASRTGEEKNVLPVVPPSCSFHVATPQRPVRRRESITNSRTDLGEGPACRRDENRSIKEPVSMEMTPIPPIADPVVKLIRLENLPRTILAKNRTSIADDKATEQNRRRESIGVNGGESANVVRTFTNENVCPSESIAIVKGGKRQTIKHSIVWKAIPPDNDRTRVHRRESAEDNFENLVGRAKKDNTRKPVLDLGRRCTSTTRSSLRVNTSLDSLRESVVADKRSSDSSTIGDTRGVAGTTRIESEQGCNFDSSNNLSTIEKLRNISVATITSVSCKSRVGGESEARRSIRTIPNKGITAAGVERTGRIGSTRLVRRAPLLESRVHDYDDDSTCQEQTRTGNDNDSNENYTDNRENPLSYLAKDKRKTLNARKSRSDPIGCGRKSFSLGTTILDDTPRPDEKAPDQVRDPVVIEDSAEEMNSFVSEKEKVAADRASKRGKKKLLPLRDSLQLLTFSPLQSQNSSASTSARTKPRRRRNRAKAVTKTRAVARADEGRAESRDMDANEVAMVRTWSSSADGPDTPRIRKTKLRKPRKVISKKIVVKKTVCLDVSIRSGGNGLNSTICNSESATRRSSTNDFSAKNPFSAGTRRKRSRKIFIVTTGLIKSDKSLVKSIVKFLGSAEMEANVTRRTTHVVSAGLRTANLLRGIIRGCWLVSLEWVLASLECKRWLDPTRFEMAHFSKAVRENRGDRQLFGDAYVPELFATCGFIYIENATTPPTALLKELIKTAGGRITDNPENAKIIVGSRGVKEIWVLDSITTGDLQSLDRYYRN